MNHGYHGYLVIDSLKAVSGRDYFWGIPEVQPSPADEKGTSVSFPSSASSASSTLSLPPAGSSISMSPAHSGGEGSLIGNIGSSLSANSSSSSNATAFPSLESFSGSASSAMEDEKPATKGVEVMLTELSLRLYFEDKKDQNRIKPYNEGSLTNTLKSLKQTVADKWGPCSSLVGFKRGDDAVGEIIMTIEPGYLYLTPGETPSLRFNRPGFSKPGEALDLKPYFCDRGGYCILQSTLGMAANLANEKNKIHTATVDTIDGHDVVTSAETKEGTLAKKRKQQEERLKKIQAQKADASNKLKSIIRRQKVQMRKEGREELEQKLSEKFSESESEDEASNSAKSSARSSAGKTGKQGKRGAGKSAGSRTLPSSGNKRTRAGRPKKMVRSSNEAVGAGDSKQQQAPPSVLAKRSMVTPRRTQPAMAASSSSSSSAASALPPQQQTALSLLQGQQSAPSSGLDQSQMNDDFQTFQPPAMAASSSGSSSAASALPLQQQQQQMSSQPPMQMHPLLPGSEVMGVGAGSSNFSRLFQQPYPYTTGGASSSYSHSQPSFANYLGSSSAAGVAMSGSEEMELSAPPAASASSFGAGPLSHLMLPPREQLPSSGSYSSSAPAAFTSGSEHEIGQGSGDEADEGDDDSLTYSSGNDLDEDAHMRTRSEPTTPRPGSP